MRDVLKAETGNLTVLCVPPHDPHSVIKGLTATAIAVAGKGRGGIRVFDVAGLRYICRQYLHGGLLRGVTGDLFLSARRAEAEMDLMRYLQEKGFPVVRPAGIIVEKQGVFRRLYLLTVLEEETVDLIQYLGSSTKRNRYRAIRRLARLVSDLQRLCIYHPDFHLQNILVKNDGALLALDFDKARQTAVTTAGMKKMFWRLARYTAKMEQEGQLTVSPAEMTLFLRTFRKISGEDLLTEMMNSIRAKRLIARAGWFVDSLLYKGRKQGKGPVK
jgi:hypothetical protein